MSLHQEEQAEKIKKEVEEQEGKEANELAFTIAHELRVKRIELQRKGNPASKDMAERLERAAQIVEGFEDA